MAPIQEQPPTAGVGDVTTTIISFLFLISFVLIMFPIIPLR